jgi:hypothetical protein
VRILVTYNLQLERTTTDWFGLVPGAIYPVDPNCYNITVDNNSPRLLTCDALSCTSQVTVLTACVDTVVQPFVFTSACYVPSLTATTGAGDYAFQYTMQNCPPDVNGNYSVWNTPAYLIAAKCQLSQTNQVNSKIFINPGSALSLVSPEQFKIDYGMLRFDTDTNWTAIDRSMMTGSNATSPIMLGFTFAVRVLKAPNFTPPTNLVTRILPNTLSFQMVAPTVGPVVWYDSMRVAGYVMRNLALDATGYQLDICIDLSNCDGPEMAWVPLRTALGATSRPFTMAVAFQVQYEVVSNITGGTVNKTLMTQSVSKIIQSPPNERLSRILNAVQFIPRASAVLRAQKASTSFVTFLDTQTLVARSFVESDMSLATLSGLDIASNDDIDMQSLVLIVCGVIVFILVLLIWRLYMRSEQHIPSVQKLRVTIPHDLDDDRSPIVIRTPR